LRQMAEVSGHRCAVSGQHGDPAGVILMHAGARRPDLIVLGTHQIGG
jgi:nucleotide-binding universal stress UspA family protein